MDLHQNQDPKGPGNSDARKSSSEVREHHAGQIPSQNRLLKPPDFSAQNLIGHRAPLEARPSF
eukprot:8141225-Pyramimonas_sp.AAC.1